MSQKAYTYFLKQTYKKNKKLHAVIKQYGPIRLLKRNKIGLPVLLCRSITGQQLSVKAAATIWGRLLDAAKDKPLMQYLDKAQAGHLRACGLSKAKTKAMFAVADAYKNKLLDVQTLNPMPHEKRSEPLPSIWGVGQWTADMQNIFYFGEKDIWPDKDVAVRKNFLKLISENKNSIQQAKQFSPYRSYMALYMWRVANAKPT